MICENLLGGSCRIMPMQISLTLLAKPFAKTRRKTVNAGFGSLRNIRKEYFQKSFTGRNSITFIKTLFVKDLFGQQSIGASHRRVIGWKMEFLNRPLVRRPAVNAALIVDLRLSLPMLGVGLLTHADYQTMWNYRRLAGKTSTRSWVLILHKIRTSDFRFSWCLF
jgi:hypothetical protein